MLYDYTASIDRPPLDLPNDARLALWIAINVEYYLPDRPATAIVPATAQLNPDPLNVAWREYGLRAGLWRLCDTLEKHGLPVTAILNSDVCTVYPRVIEEGTRRGWRWVAHGKDNSTFPAEMKVEEERAMLSEMLGTIERATGQRPRGWLGPALNESHHTPELLGELGVDYLLDWCNDDQPYRLNVTSRTMVSVPYSIEVNDIPLFVGKSLSGPDFERIVKDQFDVLYEEGERSGKVMALPLHPFVIGQPFRIRYLDSALEYILGHDRVWLTTSDDIASWYLDATDSV
jgi:peptidoglycan/xylan/chitin deacetylase (PgdA/CDA1 family)